MRDLQRILCQAFSTFPMQQLLKKEKTPCSSGKYNKFNLFLKASSVHSFFKLPETRSICFLCLSVISTPVTGSILCYSGTGSDRFSRILRHMLTQRRWESLKSSCTTSGAVSPTLLASMFLFYFTVSTRCIHL